MTRFVEPAEIESGWRTLTPAETSWAEQLLDAAGAWIRGKVPTIQEGDPNAVFVSLDVVRAALAPGTQLGMSAFSKAIGPWSKSGTLVNPQGHLDFTKFHRDLLGINETPVPLYSFTDGDY